MDKFEPKRILCPIDFSDHSKQALRLAGALAKAFDANLIVLHAQRLEAPAYFTEAQIAALKSHLRRSARAARALTEEFSRLHIPPELAYSVQVVEADPVTAILDLLKESKAGLIVMGTHGRSGFTRIRLGSVTENILRQSNAPVMTVGPQIKASTSLETIRRVLAAVDYSQHARRVLESAASLTVRTGADLIVAHVAPETQGNQTDTELRRALCEWVAPEVRSRCEVSEEVRRGLTAEGIIAAARQRHASIIVVGTVRRRFLGSVHLGRATEAIVRAAPCPVFAIPG